MEKVLLVGENMAEETNMAQLGPRELTKAWSRFKISHTKLALSLQKKSGMNVGQVFLDVKQSVNLKKS